MGFECRGLMIASAQRPGGSQTTRYEKKRENRLVMLLLFVYHFDCSEAELSGFVSEGPFLACYVAFLKAVLMEKMSGTLHFAVEHRGLTRDGSLVASFLL